MDPRVTEEVPEIVCTLCGQQMRLVGVERDPKNPAVHIQTFECRNGHYATATFPP